MPGPTSPPSGNPAVARSFVVDGSAAGRMEWRCLNCNALLGKVRLVPGLDTEIKCYRKGCGCLNTIRTNGDTLTLEAFPQRPRP